MRDKTNRCEDKILYKEDFYLTNDIYISYLLPYIVYQLQLSTPLIKVALMDKKNDELDTRRISVKS